MQSQRDGNLQHDERGETGHELALAAEEMAVQLELVKLADEELPLGVAYKRFLDLAHRAIAFEHGTLHVTEWGSGRLVPVAVRGNSIDLADQVRFARGRGLSAWVAQEGRPVVIPDPQTRAERSPFQDGGLRAFLAFPLVQNGMVAGVLALARSDRIFTPDEFARLGRVSESLAGCLGRLRRTARLRELVHQDPDTGMSNHHHFLARVEEELQRARQHAVEFTVAVVQLEGTPVRDQWPMVETITRRLSGSMRSCDLAVTFGSGRWGLLLAGVSPDRAASVVDRIRADVRQAAGVHLRVGLAASADAPASAQALLDRAVAGAERARVMDGNAGDG